MLNRTLTLVLLIVTSCVLAYGQSQNQELPTGQQADAQRAANVELNLASSAYQAGKFIEAQRHSQRALQIDPSNRAAPTFIARSIHAQYRERDDSPENIAIAHEAIAAYEKFLLIEPTNEEAFKAVEELFGAIGENDNQYSWILQHAYNRAVSTDKRVEAYVILAGKNWNCSFEISENYENKQVAQTESGEEVIVYKKPKEQIKFYEVQQCAIRGMEMADAAITLDAENFTAWSFKANLLLEMAKVAEMNGDEYRRDDYRRLANESYTYMDRLIGKREELEVAGLENSEGVASGSVLKGHIISKPLPPYPLIARTARAQGIVVVQIIIDELGNVISAKAVSGHPLLRAAAVQAARRAVFSPTVLSGQPVKVTGKLSYNFSLK